MKPTDLKCYKQVAAVIGEAYADYELQRVIDCTDCHFSDFSNFHLASAFDWDLSPQDGGFWNFVDDGENPYKHGLPKPKLSEIILTNSDKGTVPKTGIGDKGEPNEKLKDELQRRYNIAFNKQRSVAITL